MDFMLMDPYSIQNLNHLEYDNPYRVVYGMTIAEYALHDSRRKMAF